MTPELVQQWAREAGLLYHIPFPSDSQVGVALARFAALACAHQADLDAKLCEYEWDGDADTYAQHQADQETAAAIRANAKKGAE